MVQNSPEVAVREEQLDARLAELLRIMHRERLDLEEVPHGS